MSPEVCPSKYSVRLTTACHLILLLSFPAYRVEAVETQADECTPFVVQVSPVEPIRAETGSWKILFKVALCSAGSR